MENRRDEFLLKMYEQLMNDINRHISVVWQSIGTLIGAFAVFVLVEKNIISIDYATCIIVLLVGWLWAHLHDASYWYNRNLAMVANIEKDFLEITDLRNIHYYFGKHRPNKMIGHFRIQYALGFGILFVVLFFHFLTRIAPHFLNKGTNFEILSLFPYIVLLALITYLTDLKKSNDKSFNEFMKYSPGKQIDTTGIDYGVGHGFKNKKEQG